MSAIPFSIGSSSVETFKDVVDASALPDPTTLNNGDYYIIATGGTNWGKTWNNKDRAISDGTSYKQQTDATSGVAAGGTGATTPEGARANLEVPSIDESGSMAGAKQTAPAVYFDGDTANMVVAHDAKLNFSDVNSDRPFAIRLSVIFNDDGSATVIAKEETSSTREWNLYKSATEKVVLRLWTDATNYVEITSDVTVALNQIYNLVFNYDGDASNPGLTLFINGVKDTAATIAQTGTYTGMSALTGALQLADSDLHGNGAITLFRATILNRHLSDAEAAAFCRTGVLQHPASNQWASAHGAVAKIDGVTGVYTGSGGLTPQNVTLVPNQSLGGRTGVLQLDATTTGPTSTRLFHSAVGVGKREEIFVYVYIPSSNATINQVRFLHTSGTIIQTITTTDQWVKVRLDHLVDGSQTIQLVLLDDGANNATAGDSVYIDEYAITQTGVMLDLLAENFDPDTGKWHGVTDNGFVGVNSNGELTGPQQPSYKAEQWTPGLEFGGANTDLVIAASSGTVTRDGNQAHFHGSIALSAKGIATGAARITGLKYTGADLSGDNMAVTIGRYSGMAGLTGALAAQVVDNANEIALQQQGATSTTDLTHANFTDTTVITFSGTMTIQ